VNKIYFMFQGISRRNNAKKGTEIAKFTQEGLPKVHQRQRHAPLCMRQHLVLLVAWFLSVF